MTSRAYDAWHVNRAATLDELRRAHRDLRGGGPGRRWGTQQLNWALIIRLAAEFQGFSVDLHDLAAEVFADHLAQGNLAAYNIVRVAITKERKLNFGNANKSNLNKDFGRFGIANYLDDLRQADPRADARLNKLEYLSIARNGIAHSDMGKVSQVEAAGYPLTLKTFRNWRSALSGLAGTMDRHMSSHLASVLGVAPPW